MVQSLGFGSNFVFVFPLLSPTSTFQIFFFTVTVAPSVYYFSSPLRTRSQSLSPPDVSIIYLSYISQLLFLLFLIVLFFVLIISFFSLSLLFLISHLVSLGHSATKTSKCILTPPRQQVYLDPLNHSASSFSGPSTPSRFVLSPTNQTQHLGLRDNNPQVTSLCILLQLTAVHLSHIWRSSLSYFLCIYAG